jgi:MFS family permease
LLLLTETEAAGLRTPLALAVIFLATGAWFLVHERRAPQPIVSIELWARRLMATSNASTLLAGMALIGLTTVLPIYVQGVLGRSPVVAGFTLTSLVIGWPLAVMQSARLYRAFGIRQTLRLGSVLFPIGAVFLLFLTPQSHPLLAAAGSFLMGCGMGLMSVTSIALVQESVEWSMRGSATASLLFARSLGSTIGATAVGAVLNIGVAHFGSGVLAADVHKLLNEPTGLTQLSTNPTLRSIFAHAIQWSFVGIAVLAVLTLAATWLIPVRGQQPEDDSQLAAANAVSRRAERNIDTAA